VPIAAELHALRYGWSVLNEIRAAEDPAAIRLLFEQLLDEAPQEVAWTAYAAAVELIALGDPPPPIRELHARWVREREQ